MHRPASRLLWCVFASFTLWSCGSTSEATNTTTVSTLASVSVSLAPSTIQVGQTTTATAAGLDQNGKPLAISGVSWSSASPSVATVGSAGVVSAVAAGQTTITAATGGKQGSATLVVQVASNPAIDYAIAGAQFTQGVQVADGSIPMVLNGNAAAVNVLVRASSSRQASMQVVLRIFDAAGVLTRSDTAVTTGTLGPNPTYDSPTVQFMVPASVFKTGLRWQVVRDPKGAVPDDAVATDVFPRSGTAPLSVVNVPPLTIRFVPITLAAHGNATGAVSAATLPQYLRTLMSVHPLGVVNAHVGPPLVTNASFGTAPSGGAAAFWQQVIAELDLARIADPIEPDANWYGVVVPPSGFNNTSYGGFSYIPTTAGNTGAGTRTSAAVQINWFFNPTQARDLVAHEIGHTFGRLHAPCGSAGSPLDPTFPTIGGTLEQAGHDVFGWANGFAGSALTIPASTGDVMGYCNPAWASAYTYTAVMAFRGAAVLAYRAPEPISRVLVVRGSIRNGRSIALDPAFTLDARPTQSPTAAEYVLEGFDDRGQRLFSAPFTPFVLDHAPDLRPFTVAVPTSTNLEARLTALVVRGPAGVARVERKVSGDSTATRRPSRITREADGAMTAACGDPESRGIAVLRADGSVVGSAPAATLRYAAAAGTPFTIVCSDGVRTTRHSGLVPE